LGLATDEVFEDTLAGAFGRAALGACSSAGEGVVSRGGSEEEVADPTEELRGEALLGKAGSEERE
jgi:hypothetical protein